MGQKLNDSFNPLCDMTAAQRIAIQERNATGLKPTQFVDSMKFARDPQKYGLFKFQIPEGKQRVEKEVILSEDQIADMLRSSRAEIDRASRERENLLIRP